MEEGGKGRGEPWLWKREGRRGWRGRGYRRGRECREYGGERRGEMEAVFVRGEGRVFVRREGRSIGD